VITTHVLDTSTGRPAGDVGVRLERDGGTVSEGRTDADGRWTAASSVATGRYRLVFATGEHYGGTSFHPEVSVDFLVTDAEQHHHVPLLLSPFGYTTYRGS
jgi:5-hydroxyisourate hydrolase